MSFSTTDKRDFKREVRKIIDDLSCDPCYQRGDDCCDDFRKHEIDMVIHNTPSDRTRWDNKSDFSGSYNDLRDKPDLSDYYPISGGALTGNIIERNTDNDHLGISGAYWGHGAYLWLSGQNSGYGGAWYLSARDTEKSCDLIGTPSGVLSWGGKLVATEDDLANYATKTELNAKANDDGVVHNSGNENVAGVKTFGDGIVSNLINGKTPDTIEEQGEGYIRYSSGLQICYISGEFSHVVSEYEELMFPKSFIGSPTVCISGQSPYLYLGGWVGTYAILRAVVDLTDVVFTLIAIGRWK